jgi:hypothetical protein
MNAQAGRRARRLVDLVDSLRGAEDQGWRAHTIPAQRRHSALLDAGQQRRAAGQLDVGRPGAWRQPTDCVLVRNDHYF